MLAIKLTRTGRKKQPCYRVIVSPKHQDPWGKATEIVGHYNPRDKESGVILKEDRIKHWLSVGAQPTETVHNMLVTAGIIDAKKVKASSLGKKYKKKIADEKAAEQEKAQKAKEEAEAAKQAEKEAADAKAKESAEAEAKPAEEEKKAPETPAETPEEKKEEAATEEKK